MSRLILFILGVLAAAMGLSWLADNPGTITIDWLGYRAEPTVFQAVVGLLLLVAAAMFLWSLARQLWSSPAALGNFLAKRRQRRGLDALSSGMIAIGAGDRAGATRYAVQARKALPNEPLTHLLRAQAAQLSGDRATARRIFEAMLASPDTEQLGLRGLYLEAQREHEAEAQRQFAERAHKLNGKLSWPAEGMFDLACKEGRWADALETLSAQRRHGNIDKAAADRRRAVLLAARAQGLEEQSPDKALTLAMEAHGLAPDLIPAAAIAGRIHASRGNTGKAAKIIQKTWVKSPHPELAMAYAYARIGDSPRDRLDRVKQLAALNPRSPESGIAVAQAAIEARQFDVARYALQPWLDGRLTRRIALLMARVEGEELGDKGRMREWLARAAHAGRDPAWTADGVVADQWQPISPVTGMLDAFQWRVPVEESDVGDIESLAAQFNALGAEDGVAVIDTEASASETASERGVVLAANEPRPAATSAEDVVAEEVPIAEPSVMAAPTVAAPAQPATPAIAVVEPPREAEEAQAAGKPKVPEQTQRTKPQPSHKHTKGGKPRVEPKIFVSPPAPDDPGAGSDEQDVPRGLDPYRSVQ